MQELQFLIIPIPGEETKIITKFSQQVRTLSTSVTRQQKSMKLCVKANSRDFSSSSANNESTEVSLGVGMDSVLALASHKMMTNLWPTIASHKIV